MVRILIYIKSLSFWKDSEDSIFFKILADLVVSLVVDLKYNLWVFQPYGVYMWKTKVRGGTSSNLTKYIVHVMCF